MLLHRPKGNPILGGKAAIVKEFRFIKLRFIAHKSGVPRHMALAVDSVEGNYRWDNDLSTAYVDRRHEYRVQAAAKMGCLALASFTSTQALVAGQWHGLT